MRATAGVGRAGAAAGSGARRAAVSAGPGFSVGAGRASAAAVPAAAGTESLLALQALAAAPPDPSAAAAHAEVMLDRLGDLQRAVVMADPLVRRAALAGLAEATDAVPSAVADPVLAEILEALALRAAIELARSGG